MNFGQAVRSRRSGSVICLATYGRETRFEPDGYQAGRLKVSVNLKDLQDNARRATALLKAMSNQHRLLILCQLVDGEKCVGQLKEVVDLSQSALSQHLARLRRDNLVKTRRSAQTIYYSLAGDEAGAVIRTLHDLYCSQQESSVYARGSGNRGTYLVT